MNLNQITLPVSDMQKATQFYRTMGFLQIVDTPHYARFESIDGDATFSLSLDNDTKPHRVTIYFEHEAVDQVVKQLEAKGIAFSQQPTDQGHLWREAILYDPSGNKIKLYWAGKNRLNPPWRVELRE